ncbi:MAG: hypothetical protein EP330_28865 [Deltaproteobacteria bacterium]|nr:MAG: hypothetical protein EP330_28865 [Deltaproteobacteria bacterium]
MSSALRNLLRDSLGALLVAVLFFLWVSSFFTAWEGQAVSVRSPRDTEPAAYTVLIVDEKGGDLEVDWPAKVVEGRELAFNDRGVPPADIPESAPQTRKSRFQLVFYVENAEGVNDVVPTTSPRGLGLSALVWLLLIALRNMVTSGSPLDYEPREREIIQEQGQTGQLAPPTTKRVSQKTRPDQRRRRGKKKR